MATSGADSSGSRPEPLRRLFVIGPAATGKSTCGALLARQLGFAFRDQDVEFTRRVAGIDAYIGVEGYRRYCDQNVELFGRLVEEQATDTVFALSSGFLLYQDLDDRFARLSDELGRLGVSILLLPSRSAEVTEAIIAKRVLACRIGTNEAREREKIRRRYPRYLTHGDIQVFSDASPDDIAREMKSRYLAFLDLR